MAANVANTGLAWDTREYDIALNEVQGAMSKPEYERALAKVAKRLARGQADDGQRQDGDPINRRLWGLAIRAHEYTGPGLGRAMLPIGFGHPKPTYFEAKVLKWAFPRDGKLPKESKAKPTAGYIANLLQRPVEWVQRYSKPDGRRGPGFGILR